MSEDSVIEVAVGAVVDDRGRVLVALRPDHVHQGGKWEFPGGKREPGETGEAALKRELHEELGISVRSASPLITLTHRYPDKTVVLNVWRVDAFDGEPAGLEGQPVRWREINNLSAGEFPPANHGIIRALQLPDRCLVTPDLQPGREEMFLGELQAALEGGTRLVIFRGHALNRAEYTRTARSVSELALRYGARCMLNAPGDWLAGLRPAGWHLAAARLRDYAGRPRGFDGWISASCHCESELTLARNAGVDFVLLSPVNKTRSHPRAEPMGWDRFSELVRLSSVPVYALGGVGPADLEQARRRGAQGVAGISAFWPRLV